MRDSYFVDTNIFLRFLTNDEPKKADEIEKIFRKCLEGEIKLYTSVLVIAEIIWTLESYYKFPKEEISFKIEILLNTPGLEIESKELLTESLILYQRKNIDFIDSSNAIYMQYLNLKSLYSYDKHFDKISDLKRIEP